MARRSVVAAVAGRRPVAVHRAAGARARRRGDGGHPRVGAGAARPSRSTLADLAAHARMSVRTFTRRFREETGMSATRWLVQQRVSHARHLLETTDPPVERVATDAGFGTAASLRQHLHAAIGVAPLTYRRTFRGTASLTRCDRVTPPWSEQEPGRSLVEWDVPAPPSLIRSGRNRRRAEAAPPRCARLSDVSLTM